MKHFNDYQELIQFLCENYEMPACVTGTFEFNNHTIEIGGFLPNIKVGSLIVSSITYPGTVFIVTDDGYEGVLLSIIRHHGFVDQMLGVCLPKCLKEELLLALRTV